MTLNTILRRSLCALGAAAALGLGVASPANARFEPGDPIGSSAAVPAPRPSTIVYVDDNALEVLQVGGGVLAGLALAGAGWAMASRRHGASPHLA